MKKAVFISCMLMLCGLPLISKAQLAYCNEEGSLVSIRNTLKGNTEELIFTFKQAAEPIVSDNVGKPPFTNYGGDKVRVKGSIFREIHFQSVNWTCKTRNQVKYDSLVTDIKETERFEGYITYVVGLAKGVKFDKQLTENGAKTRKIIYRFKKV